MFVTSLRRVCGLSIAFICLLALGCGGSGHRVSGKVTFNGQPIKAGKIYFIPDGGKGNKGPTGFANIKDGKYDTGETGGANVGNGPMIVAIEGIDPDKQGKAEKGDTSGETTVAPLFPRYETSADLTGVSSKDFEVPADAANGPKTVAPKVIIP